MGRREKFFHEDDYCRQQLLPAAATEFAEVELRKIAEFADAHRAPGGLGWTAMYAGQQAPVELGILGIQRERFGEIVSEVLPRFDMIYTGFGSHRQQCRNAAAWGRSEQCVLYADWNDDGVIVNVWTEFFEYDEASILAASKAVAALGALHPLVYVDWAWGYTCKASDEEVFASMLRGKLKVIAEKIESSK